MSLQDFLPSLVSVFLWPGIVEFISTGKITLHWSRVIAGAFTLFSVLQISIFVVLMKVVEIWSYEQTSLEKKSYELKRVERINIGELSLENDLHVIEPDSRVMK